MIYLVVLVLGTVILAFVLMKKVGILFRYCKNSREEHLLVSFFIRGFTLSFEIPLVDIENTGLRFKKVKRKNLLESQIQKDDKNRGFEGIYNQIAYLKDFYDGNKDIINRVWKYAKKRLILKELRIDAVIGVKDAFYTGILTGIAWIAAGVAVSFLSDVFNTCSKKININADFMYGCFKIDICCIFNIKIVHIIVVLLPILVSQITKKVYAGIRSAMHSGSKTSMNKI